MASALVARFSESVSCLDLPMASLSSNFAALIDAQSVHVIPSFELECGQLLSDVPVAYKTWGTLDDARANVMVICHAFTGSADVEDWYEGLV